jgi:hypothetical protein
VTIKLLWFPGPAHYSLRVFAGPDSDHRAFSGEIRLRPDEAAEFRSLLFAGDATLGWSILSEAGWVAPPTPSSSAAA